MTFFEKYPQLQEKGFLKQVLTETVFATMALEDQMVPRHKVEEIVSELLSEVDLKKTQFESDQIS